jgi:ATP-dependent RNA helicase RhlE
VPGDLKSALLTELVKRGEIRSVIAFTRTKHRANRLADYLVRNGVAAERIHGMRSQSQRTDTLRRFKAGKFPVLVATDLAARGIDVEELSHVINFDVPKSPEDYVHRVGRTGRASATGDAFVFVAPEEEGDMQRIERTIGARLPRVTVDGFDYRSRPKEKLEIPLADRLAAMRAQKQRARSNAARGANGPSRGANAPARPWDRSRGHSSAKRRHQYHTGYEQGGGAADDSRGRGR